MEGGALESTAELIEPRHLDPMIPCNLISFTSLFDSNSILTYLSSGEPAHLGCDPDGRVLYRLYIMSECGGMTLAFIKHDV